MKFCIRCGAPVEAEDRFCSKCGHRVPGSAANLSDALAGATKEPRHKLFCELAYTGTLFWLPLLTCPELKNARYYANQGAWLLILSVLACTSIRLLSAINDLLSGGLLGAVFGGIYSLLFILFLFGILFLLWSAVTRVIAIHRDEKVKPILFFDQVQIIQFEQMGRVC